MHETPKQTPKLSLGVYCLFGISKARFSTRKTLNMGSVLYCWSKFLPFTLSLVTHLWKTREHLNECQQQSDIRAHSASSVTIGTGLGYQVFNVHCWLCSASSKCTGALSQERSPSVSLKDSYCFVLLLHAGSPGSEERFTGLQCC